MTLPRALRWFDAPAPTSPEASRRARALWKLQWSFLGVLATLFGVATVLMPQTIGRRAVSILAVAALTLVIHAINRAGRTNLASWLLVLGLTAVLTQRAWITGGVHSPVDVFYLLFVLMAGGLLGTRGSVVTAAVCLVCAIALAVGAPTEIVAPIAGLRLTAVYLLVIVLGLAGTLVALTLLLKQARRSATDDLIQMFVHDMRSPLTVIAASLAMLREDVPPDSEMAEHVDAARANAIRLNALANNFLDVHRMEAGSMPVRRAPTDVAALARDVVAGLRVLSPTRQIEVCAPRPALCDGDPQLVRRIIENLLGNAIKHTPPDSAIRIDVSGNEERMQVAVRDEGPGIPVDLRTRLFERYSATSVASDRGAHSVGLGLAFCALAVKAHGGAIRVESGDPRGSVFIVELPTRA
ncbi:MAG TPA: ATP-binding protein [Gemmatimonadaceae bacterium]|nr:ATP-binding protein [Gemmatimonadaceae bacterium]